MNHKERGKGVNLLEAVSRHLFNDAILRIVTSYIQCIVCIKGMHFGNVAKIISEFAVSRLTGDFIYAGFFYKKLKKR